MKLRLVIAFFSFSHLLFSQQKSDSLQPDSLNNHFVRKAVIFSAIVPTGGQIYNYTKIAPGTKGRNNLFWKAPLIYASIGATGYFLVHNQATVVSLKQEYRNRENNVPANQLNPKWTDYDSVGIVAMYKKVSTRRDLSILAFGATYLFQIVDAGIGAHFVDFDISDDLTLHIRPTILNNTTAGIGFTFNFR